MAPRKYRPRPKVPKTKTFGGCWTCRRRKVKCDNARPRCKRCSKDFQCEGYDIALFWMPDGYNDEPEPPLKGRKAMLLHDKRIPTSCKVADIHEMLESLDEAEKESVMRVNHEAGPFSVFHPDRPETTSQKSLSCDSLQSYEAFGCCENSIYAISSSPEPDLCLELINETQMVSFENGVEVTDQTSSFRNVLTRYSLIDFELHIDLFSDKSTAELMHNYITIVSDVLQPASHRQNPYKSIYIPNALMGSADSLSCIGMQKPSHCNAAVFHAILSVSAFHLRGTDASGERAVFDKLGRSHRGKAFEHLRNALVDELDVSNNHAAMSAMMSLVSSDVMEGGMTEFWIHLDGCERLQRLIPDNQIVQEPYKQLHSVCSFMATMARSTQQDFIPIPWLDPKTTEAIGTRISSPFHVDDHSLEFTYGLTASLASFIHRTTKFYHHLVYYTKNRLSVPESLQSAIKYHKRCIETWSISQESFSSIDPIDHDTLTIIRHHSMAFYQAVRIHFCTLVMPNSAAEIASYSRSTLENLLAAEAFKLSREKHCGWKSMAPVVWPGFIASCEADASDRDLWRSWWVVVQKYRIGSITRLWCIVREVWDSRDDGFVEIPGWAPILRAKAVRVISGG